MRKQTIYKEDKMKIIMIFTLLFTMITPCFAESPYYTYPSGGVEVPLPNFHTEYEYKRYENSRRIFFWSGLACAASSAYLFKRSSSLKRKANRTEIVDRSIVLLDENRTGYHPIIQGNLNSQRRLYNRSSNYKEIASILALLGAAGLTISFSLRF
jgi:hypothetical protein